MSKKTNLQYKKNTTNSNTWLSQFAKSVTSQGGEDGILEKILSVIKNTNKWCVEFGSWDGKKLSNTYNLIENHDYSAVLIEGNKKRFQDLLKTFGTEKNVIPINTFVGFQENDNLDKILASTPIPVDFDLLSIDIDGNDYHVWDAVRNYSPKVVVIEFNPTVPPCVEFVQAKDMTVNQGSGILSMVNLAKKKGYELVAVESANAFFVKKQYFELFEISDNSIDQLWLDQSAVTHIFFGYDTTVFLRGLKVHPWQSIAIDESKMQLLPRWARKKFGGQNYFVRKLAKHYRKMKKVTTSDENRL
jgi:hypothetical protein